MKPYLRSKFPERTKLIGATTYLVGTILIWHFYVEIAEVPNYLLPGPIEVSQEFVRLLQDNQLLPNLAYTVRNIIFGFAGGCLIGMTLGWFLHHSQWFRLIINPYVILLQSAPKIAIAPLLVLWFGLGFKSQLVLILMLAFFPMTIATLLGLQSINTEVHTLARLLDMGILMKLRIIEFPAALPSLIAGMKLAIVDSMTGAFLAEYISAQRGLGYLMVLGNTSYNTPMLIAAVLLTVAVGLLGYATITVIEIRVLKWKK